MRVIEFDPAHAFDHTFAVTVRRVYHDRIHAGFDQSFHALFGPLAHTHSGAHEQAPCCIARSIGEIELFGDVFDRDQAFELEVFVDHQQTLEFVFVQECFGLFWRCAFRHGDQALARCHDLTDGLVIARLKPHVAPCDNAHHASGLANGEARDTQLLRQGHDLAHFGLGGDDHWISQHARFVALDFGHMRGLLLRR